MERAPVLEGKASNSAGTHALAGFEYQIDVSVWLALHLVLAAELTDELVLEPTGLSQEDLETDLAEHAVGLMSAMLQIDTYRLVVQAKLRSGDAWTPAGIRSLLRHGKVRTPAAERLHDPDVRYLLVTSAALNGEARKLGVRQAGEWPKVGSLPPPIAGVLPPDAAGRLALIGREDQERLETDIKRLLTERFRVPNATWQECRKTLRAEARARILGYGSGRWIRSELERVIRDHDGYIASSPELQRYVYPSIWADLRTAMRERHAALLLGQSGTGKTLAIEKLFEELSAEIPGLKRVSITGGPTQLETDRTPGPVLYDISDPWGMIDFQLPKQVWNARLPRAFASSRHDRLVVATSRLDVATAAGALGALKHWTILLESEHYGATERRALYRNRIDALPSPLQRVATDYESTVLDQLATPLEIQKFFDELTMLIRTRPTQPERLIFDAIRCAHESSIECTVISRIEARQDVPAAAVIWAMLGADEQCSFATLCRVENDLANLEDNVNQAISQLVKFFLAARNLREAHARLTYYHPRVESGIKKALAQHPILTRKTLQRLIDALVARDDPSEVPGTACAARVISGAARLPELQLKVSPDAQAKVDTWLARSLENSGKDFAVLLELAAVVGSPDSTVSEISRFLLHEPRERSADWYAKVRADPLTQPLIEAFIRGGLPANHQNDYDASFVEELNKLASSLSKAFLAAAALIIHNDTTYNFDVIAEGALKDLDGFESIVDTAVTILTPTEASRAQAQETLLAEINGEFDVEYPGFSENRTGYTANQFLEAYVDRLRITRGWRNLSHHRHAKALLHYWLRALRLDSAAASEDELSAAFAVAFGTHHEADLWDTVQRHWAPSYRIPLVERVLNGEGGKSTRVAALRCLAKRAWSDLQSIGPQLQTTGPHRLAEIAIELGKLRIGVPGIWPPQYAEINRAAYDFEFWSEHDDRDQPLTLSNDTRDLLIALADAGEEVRVLRMRLARYYDLPIEDDDLRWLLAHTEDSDIAVEAIEMVILRAMNADIEAALNHRFSHVVARALDTVATPLDAPLPEWLLSFVTAKGSPIRKVLVKWLAKKPHIAHLPALLRLARDEWACNSPSEDTEYPIARAAAAEIARSGSLTQEVAKSLYQIAINSWDHTLRLDLFCVLSRAGDAPMQQELLDLARLPGRVGTTTDAASALLSESKHIQGRIVAQITPDLLLHLDAPVAARLALLLALQGEINAVEPAARVLAVSSTRRVFVILLLRGLIGRDSAIESRVATLLPSNHLATSWALGRNIGEIDNRLLDDLGDPPSTEEVLQIMRWHPNEK